MIVYTTKPRARRARMVWEHATALRGRAPVALWKNPNCWGRPQAVGNAWGFWIAQFSEGREYEPILPEEV